MNGPSMDAEQWRRVLRQLAADLPSGRKVKVIVIGGAALALAYGARRTTRDVDVVLEDATRAEVLAAAERIREQFGLAEGWLNENARQAGLLVEPVLEGPVVLDAPAIQFVAPTLEHLAAMKLAALRDDTDLDDAALLMQRFRAVGQDADEVWSAVGGLVPVAERSKARYNLLKVWEILDESE